MAIRVRKLARQLQRTPVELLGVLKAIGYARYKSPEDMLSAPVEKKLRGALKEGVRPIAVQPRGVRKPVETAVAEALPDLAGVVRQQQDDRYTTLRPSKPALPPRPLVQPPPIPPSKPALAPVAEVQARAALEAELAVVDAERRAVKAEREALAAERAAWEAERKITPQGVSLADVFMARGLVVDDEAQRAIRALAEVRRLPELMPYLQVSDRVAVERWMREVLVLVDGPPPEALANEALVSVAAERADIPGAAGWRKIMGRLSEQLMLRGARRVLICGGGARAHRLLRSGFDARIDVRFRPGSTMALPDARSLSEADVVVLWSLTLSPEVIHVLRAAPVHVTIVERSGIADFVVDWTRDLAE